MREEGGPRGFGQERRDDRRSAKAPSGPAAGHGQDDDSRQLRDVDMFRGLTQRELRVLSAIGHQQWFPPGAVLAREGEQPDQLYAILRGEVHRLALVGEVEVQVDALGPGGSIPLVELADPTLLDITLRTATEVEAFVIPRAGLVELLKQEPALGMRLRAAALPVLSRQYRQALGQLMESFRRTIEEREARIRTETGAASELLLQSGKLASLGEMISTVVHEMNNPLTGVMGFAQLLLARDLEEGVRKDVEVIYKETERAVRIVKDLLAFARRHEPEKTMVSINEVIEKTLAMREYEMRVSNLAVVRHLQPDLPQTLADSHKMQQVFLNIIVNSEQAMSNAHGHGTLAVRTQQMGDLVQAIFMDDGPGIPAENLTRIFDPFFTTKGEGKGTGLGLSLSQRIVRDHGGTIRAESQLGRGATLIVEIPVVRE